MKGRGQALKTKNALKVAIENNIDEYRKVFDTRIQETRISYRRAKEQLPPTLYDAICKLLKIIICRIEDWK